MSWGRAYGGRARTGARILWGDLSRESFGAPDLNVNERPRAVPRSRGRSMGVPWSGQQTLLQRRQRSLWVDPQQDSRALEQLTAKHAMQTPTPLHVEIGRASCRERV